LTIVYQYYIYRYSTLDHETIAKLDAMTGKHRQIQHRFHAPAMFDHTNGKPQKGASASNMEGTSSANSFPFPGPLAPDAYEYSPPGFSDSESISKPVNKYPSVSTDEKVNFRCNCFSISKLIDFASILLRSKVTPE